jgi:elongation factor Ts
MAEITVALIKELRERTGCGMMDAKRALEEAGGSVEKAIDDLRKKGEVKAAKRAGRETAEGRVAIAFSADGRKAALVSLQTETDFTANNEEFRKLVQGIADAAVKGDGDANELDHPAGGKVGDAIKGLVSKTGENMQLGRVERLTLQGDGFFGQYIHSDGKLGVLVAFSGGKGDSEAEKVLAKDIAMHVAATNPVGLTKDDVPADAIAREKAVAMDQAKASGKPENIQEKIAEGKLNAFFKEHTLLAQPFVKDPSASVEQHVQNTGKTLKLAAFARVKVGEN